MLYAVGEYNIKLLIDAIATNNPTGGTTYLNTAFATFSMIYPNPAGLSRDEYLAQVVPTNVLLADIKANYTNWITALVNNIGEEDMIEMLSQYYIECDFEDCVWTAIDNGTLAFDSTYTMNYARDYYWSYLMEKLYQSNSDTFTYNAAYTRPKIIADLFETWRLPLADFMDEVETHFDVATRNALDIDTIQKVQHLWVNEWNMYGNSRLGIYQAQSDTVQGVIRSYDHRVSNDTVAQAYFAIDTLQYNKFAVDSIHYLHKGRKRYEGTNHLGNVLVAYTDKRLQVCTNDTIHYYRADIVNAYEYSPFGAIMPDRKWDSDTTLKYRFGFNGKELDQEGMGGGGPTYDYGFRIYNPNLGRFLSVDPLFRSFPWYTPYQFAGNMPIWALDMDGLEDIIFQENFKNTQLGVIVISLLNETEMFKNLKKEVKKSDQNISIIVSAHKFRNSSNKEDMYFNKNGFIEYMGESNTKSNKGTLMVVNGYRDMLFKMVPQSPEMFSLDQDIAIKLFKKQKSFILVSVNEHLLNPMNYLTAEARKILSEEHHDQFIGPKLMEFAKNVTIQIGEVVLHEGTAHSGTYLKNKHSGKKLTDEVAKEHKEYHGTESRYSPGYKDYLENPDQFEGTDFEKAIKQLENAWTKKARKR